MEKTINKQVLPQAPSPTITSFLLISDMLYKDEREREGEGRMSITNEGGKSRLFCSYLCCNGKIKRKKKKKEHSVR